MFKNLRTILVVVLICLKSTVFSQVISMKLTNVTVMEAMESLKEKSGYSFIFESSDIDTKKRINVTANNLSIDAVVKQIISSQTVQYEILGKSIVIKKLTNSTPVLQTQKSASTFEVSGTVKDDKNIAVIGATVKLKNSIYAAVTDLNGKFRLSGSVNEGNLELIVSFIGYVQQIVPVKRQAVVEIVLEEDSKKLSEVVVTAMGIERKSKSLTYATQTVGGQEFTRSKDASFINSLQGKSAGLQITPNSSGAGGGATKIILRGQSDMYGNNQPLIVLDGMPLSSGMGSQVGGNMVMGGSRDGGDLLSMINPDDIANMTILKGPNAAALYGSKANNGVLIITTKKGREGKLRVDVSSNTVIESPIMMPQIQSIYGGEIQGYSMKLNGWGGKISDISSNDIARLPYLSNTAKDNLSNFFSNGINTNNSLSINGGTENYQSYFSYGNTQAKGLIENNTFSRHNLLFKQAFSLFNKHLTATFSANYIRQETKNQPVVGKALSPLLALYRSPRSVDMRYFEQNYQHIATPDDPLLAMTETGNRKLAGHQIQSWPWFDQYLNNPYWLLNKSAVNDIKDRILTSATIKSIINENLNVQARLNIDQNTDRSTSQDYATLNIDSRLKGGRHYSGRSYSSDIYSDYLLSYNKLFNDKIDVSATAGTSFNRKYNLNMSYVNYLDTAALPNVFLPENHRLNDIQNSVNTTERWGTYWESAVFATAQIGFFDVVNVDGSYRMDWAKPFQQFAEPGKYKYFDYYSVGGNVLLKELFYKDLDWMNALKFRSSYSMVGNSIPDNQYGAYSIDFNTGAVGRAPAAFDLPRPNMTESFEAGIDGSLFNSKFNFDLTFYNSILKNQFRWITTSSGQSKPVNGGSVQNRGLELTSSYRFDFNRDFTWTTGVTMAFNDNKVLTMYTDSSGVEKILEDGSKEFHYKQIAGNSYGDLYVNSFERNADGTLVLNYDGSPKAVAGKYDTYIGNATARFTFGFNNTFRYKDFSLYMLIDGKIGGKVLSVTEADLDFYGLSQRSSDARAQSYPKTYQDNNGKEYTELFFKLPNGQEVNTRKYFEVAGANPNELYAYDATNVRLRELSLGYTFVNAFGSAKNLTVSLVGKNVLFLYKNSPVDPDVSLSAGNGFSGVDVYSLPTTRNIGLNIKATF